LYSSESRVTGRGRGKLATPTTSPCERGTEGHPKARALQEADPNSSGLAPVVGVITSNVFELDFVLDRRKRRKERIDKEKKKKKNLKS
jgi:hypothetical protein